MLLWLAQPCVCLMSCFNCRTDFQQLFHNYNENVSNFTRLKWVNGSEALNWPTMWGRQQYHQQQRQQQQQHFGLFDLMWLLLAVWQCHSMMQREWEGGCLLIFAQLKRKRYGQAHYQRTTTATATATATFRSYSGAHNRCADMLVPVRLPACVCVGRHRGVAAKPQWHQWAISTMWRWCRSQCSLAGLATPPTFHNSSPPPYPSPLPTYLSLRMRNTLRAPSKTKRCKTDKADSRQATGKTRSIPNLTHVAQCVIANVCRFAWSS